MKKVLTIILAAVMIAAFGLLTACSGNQQAETTAVETAAEETTAAETAAEEAAAAEETTAAAEETSAPEAAAEETAAAAEGTAELEDGTYLAEFDTDSSMFHVNEANEGKGVLTVKDGKMTIHVSLVSKKILNLYPGLAEDAQKEGAELLQPTTDSVTYSDGITEEVYGFDIPVPALDEEFDCALVGEKGTWYDHKVSVSNPEPYTGE